MRIAIVALGALLFSVSAASATGDMWQRTVRGVSIPCKGMELTEQVWEGGSVTGSWAKYRLVCLKNSYDDASWVIAADASCGGDVDACQSRAQNQAFNQVKAIARHAGKTGNLTLALEKAVLGRECKRDRGVWHCKISETQPPGYEVRINARRKNNAGLSEEIRANLTEGFADVAGEERFKLDLSR